MQPRNVGAIVATSALCFFLFVGAAVAPMALTSATTTSQCQAASSYINPFSRGQWSPARTDQGVDWLPLTPSPVVAIGNGVVTYSATTGTGWPGGAFLTYQLTDGPAAGYHVYVTEHLVNLVPAGATVSAGQQLATALPGYPWTEWGWAAASGPSPAVPYQGAADGTPTASGKAFARFLESLGAKPLDDPGPGPMFPDGAAECADIAGIADTADTAGIADTGGAPARSSGTPIATPADFANAVLGGLGIASNDGNVAALVAWQLAEGGWSHDNPLNTTMPEPGATDLAGNPAHVKVYPGMDVAAQATVSVLQEPAYRAVVTMLAGTDPYAVAKTVAASPWGTPDFSAEIGLPYNP